jgi:hypothetical protein
MHYAARDRELDAMQDDAELLFENARKSFMLAGETPSSGDIARYAATGREYLELAHRAAKVEAAGAGGADRDPPQRCHRGHKVPSMNQICGALPQTVTKWRVSIYLIFMGQIQYD